MFLNHMWVLKCSKLLEEKMTSFRLLIGLVPEREREGGRERERRKREIDF